ncbi:MAG: putative LPS assembly protein LptD [Gemmatimonadales bacterium]
MDLLLQLEGYVFTRYRSDSATLLVEEKVVDLQGNAMTDRSGSIIEASAIKYREGDCLVEAIGEPKLFQADQVVVGLGARYDTCADRGVVLGALTTFPEAGANWFVRGNLAVDSSRSRLYGGSGEITSCDLPVPHYHFATKQLKWVSKSVMVARPAVLYIRDVPVAWLPFLFQDTKPGRRSGILIPQFGFNDVVRPSRGYNRQVTNIGYYWAISDYLDAQVQLDWFSNRYLQYGVSTRYAVLDRFLNGHFDYSEQREVHGGSARSISWSHQQRFNVSTTLNVDARYVTNSSIVARNSVDPRLTTQQISSSANFTRRFPWGSLTLGGVRRQNITDGSGDMTLPSLTVSPKPLDFGRRVTWSPALSFTNQTSFKTPLSPRLLVPAADSGVDTLSLTGQSRLSALSLETPLRIGSFQWRNSLRIDDADSTGRVVETFRIPNDATPDPDDSVTVTRFRSSGFQSSVDWETGINLPILFPSTWKLQPFVAVSNRTSGRFAIRNAATGGRFVQQGKRLQYGVSLAPTVYGFFPGFAGMERIRHSFSPLVSYTLSPAADVPEDYARAVARPGQPLVLRSDPVQQIQLTLSQNFEAKSRPAPGDTTGTSQRKFRILSIQTSGIGFDIEQSKKEGRTGWTSQSLSNQLLSDLLPGFSLGLTHNLWDGPVGFRSSKFDPFLESVTANFSLTGNTFRSLAALVGLASREGRERPRGAAPETPGFGGVPLPGDLRRASLLTPGQVLSRGSRPFQANVALSYTRQRPERLADGTLEELPSTGNINLSTSFSPTQFWGLSWATSYNSQTGSFEQHQISLTRDLHEWRAAFNFLKSPNGNFAFYVSVFLTDLPDIKFDYNQTTIQP